ILNVPGGKNSVFLVVETYRTNHTFSAFPGAIPFSSSTSILMTDDINNQFYLTPTIKFTRSSNSLVEIFVAPMVSHVATQLNLQLSEINWAPQPISGVATFNVPNPARRVKPQ